MDFSLSEEDELLRDTVREFCDTRIRPNAGSWDEARALPRPVLAELGELGLLAMELPPEHGGAGLSAVTATALIGELAAADGALAQVVATHNSMGIGSWRADPDGEDEELTALAEGERLVAFAGHERGATLASRRVATRARVHDGGYVLDGEKHHVVGAGDAGVLVVVATTAPAEVEVSNPDDLVLVAVPTDASGVVVGPRLRTLGMRAAATAHVRFEGVSVSSQQCLAGPGQAWDRLVDRLARGRIDTAAIACGIGRGALSVSTAYAQEREQFGRPIGKFQAIAWKLANMATTLEAAWLMTMQAAWRCDQKLPYGEHAGRAAVQAATSATQAASEALQIHGGYGYTREFPVERALRDARMCELGPQGNEQGRRLVSEAIAARFGD